MVTFIQTQSHVTHKTQELIEDEMPRARALLKAGDMKLTPSVHFIRLELWKTTYLPISCQTNTQN